MSIAAATTVSQAIASFSANNNSIHEQLSRVEFVIRIIFALSLPGALSDESFRLELSWTPGLGALREGINHILERSGQQFYKDLARIGRALLTTPLSTTEPRFRTIENLRNHLFHGGGIPDSAIAQPIATKLVSAITNAETTLNQVLNGREFKRTGTARGIMLHSSGLAPVAVSPLLALDADDTLLVFSRLTDTEVKLNGARHEQHLAHRRDEYKFQLDRVFRNRSTKDAAISDFAHAVLADLDGFREPGTLLSHLSGDEGISVSWEHAAGSEAKQRHDLFRLGPDNMWQSLDRDRSEWFGYSSFLRELANWPVLTHRVLRILEGDVKLGSPYSHCVGPDGKDKEC